MTSYDLKKVERKDLQWVELYEIEKLKLVQKIQEAVARATENAKLKAGVQKLDISKYMVIQEFRYICIDLLEGETDINESYLLIDWIKDPQSQYNFKKMYKEYVVEKKEGYDVQKQIDKIITEVKNQIEKDIEAENGDTTFKMLYDEAVICNYLKQGVDDLKKEITNEKDQVSSASEPQIEETPFTFVDQKPLPPMTEKQFQKKWETVFSLDKLDGFRDRYGKIVHYKKMMDENGFIIICYRKFDRPVTNHNIIDITTMDADEKKKSGFKEYKYQFQINSVLNVKGQVTHAKEFRNAVEKSMVQRYFITPKNYLTELHNQLDKSQAQSEEYANLSVEDTIRKKIALALIGQIKAVDGKLGIYLGKTYCQGYVETQASSLWELKSELEKWPQIYERIGAPSVPEPVEEEDPYYREVPERDPLGYITNNKRGFLTNFDEAKLKNGPKRFPQIPPVIKPEWTEVDPCTGKSASGESLTENNVYKTPPPLKMRLFGIPGFGLNKKLKKSIDTDLKVDEDREKKLKEEWQKTKNKAKRDVLKKKDFIEETKQRQRKQKVIKQLYIEQQQSMNGGEAAGLRKNNTWVDLSQDISEYINDHLDAIDSDDEEAQKERKQKVVNEADVRERIAQIEKDGGLKEGEYKKKDLDTHDWNPDITKAIEDHKNAKEDFENYDERHPEPYFDFDARKQELRELYHNHKAENYPACKEQLEKATFLKLQYKQEEKGLSTISKRCDGCFILIDPSTPVNVTKDAQGKYKYTHYAKRYMSTTDLDFNLCEKCFFERIETINTTADQTPQHVLDAKEKAKARKRARKMQVEIDGQIHVISNMEKKKKKSKFDKEMGDEEGFEPFKAPPEPDYEFWIEIERPPRWIEYKEIQGDYPITWHPEYVEPAPPEYLASMESVEEPKGAPAEEQKEDQGNGQQLKPGEQVIDSKEEAVELNPDGTKKEVVKIDLEMYIDADKCDPNFQYVLDYVEIDLETGLKWQQ